MELRDYYREKRKKDFLNKIVLILLAVPLVIMLIWGFFWIPYFRISKISVENYSNADEITNLISRDFTGVNALYLPKNNFWLLNLDNLKKLLKDRDFGAPNIDKSLPNKLLIQFNKTTPWLIFCQNQEDCFYVDRNGVSSGRAPKFSEKPLPEIILNQNKNIKIGDEIISKSRSEFLGVLFDSLWTLNITPEKIEIIANGDAKISLKDSGFILLSFNIPVDRFVSDLKLLLQKIGGDLQKLEYIDMRFPNKAFYKLRTN